MTRLLGALAAFALLVATACYAYDVETWVWGYNPTVSVYALSLVGAPSTTSTVGTSVKLSAPAGLAANDILIAAVNENGAVTTPAGWTAFVQKTTGARLYAFWKRAVGSETSTTFSQSLPLSQAVAGAEIAIRGAVLSGSPFYATSSLAGTFAATVTTTSLTTTVAGDMVLLLGACIASDSVAQGSIASIAVAGSVTSSAASSTENDPSGTGNAESVSVWYRIVSSPQATGAMNETMSSYVGDSPAATLQAFALHTGP